MDKATADHKLRVRNPEDGVIHRAFQHPVYSDHFVTSCGMVVTTSQTRHETNLTGFEIVDSSTDSTCKNCF